MMQRLILVSLLLLAAVCPLKAERVADRLVIVTLDGIRQEELFDGLHPLCFCYENILPEDIKLLKKKFWARDSAERRKKLMPFFWQVLVNQGQLFGKSGSGHEVLVENSTCISYPGYNEMFSGAVDPLIFSNTYDYNANVTVLEWLNQFKEYEGKIAVFSTWDRFPFILNAPRSGLFVNSGWTTCDLDMLTERQDWINGLIEDDYLQRWLQDRFDRMTFYLALDYLRLYRPKILYISLGDCDEWGHELSYSNYIQALHQADHYLQELFETLQSLPEYQGKTALVVTTDHGRGADGPEWGSHFRCFPHSEYSWIYVFSPDIPALGVRHGDGENHTLSQVAATIADLLGYDFYEATGRAIAKPLDLFERSDAESITYSILRQASNICK